jgi:hypothetical protein
MYRTTATNGYQPCFLKACVHDRGPIMTRVTSPFHAGEQAIQGLAGVRDRIEPNERPRHCSKRAPECPTASHLGDSEVSFIAEADTFFIASRSEQLDQEESSAGLDFSHRGGRPGFVRLVSQIELCFPDYRGNPLLNTFGNLEVDGRAGLLFNRLPKRPDAAHYRQSQDLLGRVGDDAIRWCRKAHVIRHRTPGEPRARISAFVRLCQLLAAPGGGGLGFQNSPISVCERLTRGAGLDRRTAMAAFADKARR